MEKNYKIQKKKTTASVITDIIFKILIVIALIIFIYIAFTKIDFKTGEMTFTGNKESKPETHIPSQLKWFDDFKGVENVPDKNKKKESSDSEGRSGFKYEGFGK